jgi:hypothetical protein
MVRGPAAISPTGLEPVTFGSGVCRGLDDVSATLPQVLIYQGITLSLFCLRFNQMQIVFIYEGTFFDLEFHFGVIFSRVRPVDQE